VSHEDKIISGLGKRFETGADCLYLPDMNNSLILQSLSKYIELTAYECSVFMEFIEEQAVKKKQVLLEEHAVCKHSAFVSQGCLRGYTVDQNGFEHILQFAPEGWWIADMYSLISGKPGTLIIDAIEDSSLLLLSRTDQEKLFVAVPKFERFFRIITENSLVSSRQRLIDSMSLTAEERYEAFCKRYPTLIERVPQKQIASYIGVTPEFLSKMKASLLRRKK